MKKDITEIIMNPVRLRILQYLMIHKQGTTAMIRQELSDIPPASLYRHIKTLLDAGCINVIEQKKIRGTVEKVYGLADKPFQELGEQNPAAIIQSGLLSLMNSFEVYFNQDNVDPAADMLSLSTSTLLLTDDEYMDFLKRIGGLFNEVIQNQPKEGRKQRRVTFISSPCEQ